MVSIWPWKGDDTSPASFEKALSAVTAKISKTTLSRDTLRQHSRRYKALWTLYTLLAYILLTIVLIFVLGWRNWGLTEYAGLLLTPVAIYSVRLAFVTYYDWRITSIEARLKEQEKEREGIIKKLKDATKYDSTLQLLEKYGASPKSTPTKSKTSDDKGKATDKKSDGPPPRRTGMMPPATANIPRNRGRQSLPPDFRPQAGNAPLPVQAFAPPPPFQPSEEFAPNAFSQQQLQGQPSYLPTPSESRWYDRILDVVLGEDETLSKNRLALICKECRVVNGLAAPGVRTLAEVGKWRCSNCKAWNGEEVEVEKVVEDVKKEALLDQVTEEQDVKAESTDQDTDEVPDSAPEAELEQDEEEEEVKPAKKRGKSTSKGRKTK